MRSDIIFIEDTSSNGTFLNGEKIGKGKKRILKNGQKVEILISQGGKDAIAFIFTKVEPKAETKVCIDAMLALGLMTHTCFFVLPASIPAGRLRIRTKAGLREFRRCSSGWVNRPLPLFATANRTTPS